MITDIRKLSGIAFATALAVGCGTALAEDTGKTPAAGQSQTAPAPQAGEPKAPSQKPAEFAVIGDTVVTAQEYEMAYATAKRQKFYHGTPPEGAEGALRQEVADDIINRVLVLAEAKRRGITPDEEKIKQAVAGYDQRYGDSPRYKANRDKMLEGIVKQLEQQTMAEKLEAEVRKAPQPTDEQVRAYYDSHRELFTEPEKVRVALILLKVDPSSPKEVWEKAKEEAEGIYKQLKNGADFADTAKMRSSDRSGEKGGDLGYIHRGVLPEGAQILVDKMQPGDIAEPVVLLEGVAIIRLIDRKPATPRDFTDVKERATSLWQREQGENQWKRFIADLRKATPITINQTNYPTLSLNKGESNEGSKGKN